MGQRGNIILDDIPSRSFGHYKGNLRHRLFETPINKPWAERMRKTTVPTLDTFISVGVQADLSDLPENTMFVSDTPLVCGGIKNSVIGLKFYANGNVSAFLSYMAFRWASIHLERSRGSTPRRLAMAPNSGGQG